MSICNGTLSIRFISSICRITSRSRICGITAFKVAFLHGIHCMVLLTLNYLLSILSHLEERYPK